jgi:hypothetical protein
MPALLSLLVLLTTAIAIVLRPTERAFLGVYLPVLMLLPDGYSWGNPSLTLYEFAIIPLGITLCLQLLQGQPWRWSITDMFVGGYLVWTVVSQIHASGHVGLFNHIVHLFTLNLFPYMIGKLLIEQKGVRVALMKRIVFFVFLSCLLCIFEFRLGVNPLRQLFDWIFSVKDPWPTQIRFGFGRASGTFGHAILMGTIVGIAFLLNRYLSYFQLWNSWRVQLFSGVRFKKEHLIGAALVASSAMTLSRGPWIATFVGFVVMSIGTARDQWAGLRRMLLVLACAGAGIYFGSVLYSDVSQQRGSQEDVASALYRVRLVDEYRDIASVRSLWGWGDQQWPQVKGMVSIDNWYLLEVLTYGTPGLCLFVGMLLIPAIRMIWAGFSDVALSADLRGLFFVHLGIIALIGVSVSMVFLGSQLIPLLFLFTGWGDASLLNRVMPVPMLPSFAFRPLIAFQPVPNVQKHLALKIF